MMAIAESYKKITTAKDVTTPEPKKVVKHAKLAEPAKKAVPAKPAVEGGDVKKVKGGCKKCGGAKCVCESDEGETISAEGLKDIGDYALKNAPTDSDFGSSDWLEEKGIDSPEKLRAYFKQLEIDAYRKSRDEVDARVREIVGDERFEEYMKKVAPNREKEDKEFEERVDAELDDLDRDTEEWLKSLNLDGDEDEEGASAASSAAGSSVAQPQSSAAEDDKVVINGREVSREEAKRYVRAQLSLIDSQNTDENDPKYQKKVDLLQKVLKDLHDGAAEVEFNITECVGESTFVRSL